MRLAIVTSRVGSGGGVEVFNRDISNIMKERGHLVDIFGIDSLPFKFIDPEQAVGEYFMKKNSEKPYDVVLCNGEFGYAVNHPKAISVFHGNYYSYALAVDGLVNPEVVKSRLAKVKKQVVAAQDKYLVTVSKFNALEMEKLGMKVDRIINHSVDIDLFYPRNVEIENYSLAICRGRHFEKGFDVLTSLAEMGLDIRLFSDEKINVEGVQNMGFVKNESLGKEYSSAQVFLNPTRFEGGGLTTLEAMACGCPILTTPTGYGYNIKEEIPNFVADVGDISAFLAKSILISNERRKYSKEALDYFLTHHHPDSFKRRWIEVIEGI